MKSKELCIFLERLRSARNLSQESFTDEIVSLRQYRRYLSGESVVPFQVIDQLSEKIGIKTDTLLREFEIANVEETKTVTKLFNLAVNYDHDGFLELSKELPVDQVIDKNNLLMYQHSIILDKLYSQQITLLQSGEMNARLINYPEILESQILTPTEMLILTSLIDSIDQSEHLQIIRKIEAFLDDRSTVFSGGNEKIYIFMLAKISKFFGIHEDYDNVLKFCKIGVELNISIKQFYLMEYLYYYQSLVYFKLENYADYEDTLVKCFSVLQFEGNQKKIEKFTNLIEEDFNIDFIEFAAKHFSKKEKTYESENPS